MPKKTNVTSLFCLIGIVGIIDGIIGIVGIIDGIIGIVGITHGIIGVVGIIDGIIGNVAMIHGIIGIVGIILKSYNKYGWILVVNIACTESKIIIQHLWVM